MKPRLDESTVKKIMQTLIERFGEPIGDMTSDGQGVPDGTHKKDMGNRGFGAEFESDVCEHCGHMQTRLTEDVGCCEQCGMMGMGESEGGGRHPGHASSCTCPDCSRPERQDDDLDEKAPPGREKQVKALKKDKSIDNPWAVAWASYNKSH